MWASHPEFKDLIRNSWNSEVSANEALVALKWKLLEWNRIVFGNVNDKKARLVALLDKLQTEILLIPSNALLRRESEAQVELADLLLQEESLWKQKFRECWLRDGDRNTSFFHLSTIIHRKRNWVKALKDDGNTWVYDPTALERLVVDFYRELYSIPQHELFLIVMPHNGFPPLHLDRWATLNREFGDDEIFGAVKDMGGLKAPEPDGFQPMFFHKCWETVEGSVVEVVRKFLKSATLLVGMNDTFISLTPKSSNPDKSIGSSTFEPLLEKIHARLYG
ncbi:hypothetical protein V2J09_007407 [Rumex salicifolius]